MKILFLGTPALAVPSLQALTKAENIDLLAVATPPDKPVGRKQVLTPCPVKAAAHNLNLPHTDIQTKNDLTSLPWSEADIAIVIAFGMIIPAELLDMPRTGSVNVHFSLLPQHRGASPVQSAILNGDKASGITLQRMIAELDAGDILLQKSYSITDKTTSELFNAWGNETAALIIPFLTDYNAGTIIPVPQNEKEATFCHKFTKSDGIIHPSEESALQIWNKYRAFDIWPQIALPTPHGNIKLTQITLQRQTPSDIEVTCHDGEKIYIQRAIIPGKKELTSQQIANGGYAEIFEAS